MSGDTPSDDRKYIECRDATGRLIGRHKVVPPSPERTGGWNADGTPTKAAPLPGHSIRQPRTHYTGRK
jgi:hypothetical protein